MKKIVNFLVGSFWILAYILLAAGSIVVYKNPDLLPVASIFLFSIGIGNLIIKHLEFCQEISHEKNAQNAVEKIFQRKSHVVTVISILVVKIQMMKPINLGVRLV